MSIKVKFHDKSEIEYLTADQACPTNDGTMYITEPRDPSKPQAKLVAVLKCADISEIEVIA